MVHATGNKVALTIQ